MSTVYARLLNNIKTSAEWAESDFALYEGEIGIESDTKLMKVGDGSSTWNNLPYMALSDIAGIKNVSINSPVDGQVITYNSGGWANYDIPTLPTNTDLMYYDNTNSDFAAKSDLPTDVSELTNDAGYLVQDDLVGYATEQWVLNKTYATENWVANKGYATENWVANKGYAIISESGKKALLEWTNSSTTLTCRLYDKNNNVLSTSSVIIPITSIIDSGYYDTATNDIVLVLSDQSEIRIPASGLVDGLQPKITVSDPLDANLVSGLSTVATSGNYNDLTNKPTIPAAANNGVLTIQKDGVSIGSFSANQASNTTVNITTPSLAGYATEQWVLNKTYATENWVANKGYATENWVANKGYATENWVANKGYATTTWANSTFAEASHTHDYAPSNHNHGMTYVKNRSNPNNELGLQWASGHMWYQVDSAINRKMVYEGFHNFAEVQNRNGTQLGIGVQWENDAFLGVYINGTYKHRLMSSADRCVTSNHIVTLNWDNTNLWYNVDNALNRVIVTPDNIGQYRSGGCYGRDVNIEASDDIYLINTSGANSREDTGTNNIKAYSRIWAGKSTSNCYPVCVYVQSDERLKKNIASTKIEGLELVNSIPVVDFNYKEESDEHYKHVGVIAQTIERDLPEIKDVVLHGDDDSKDMLHVDYGMFSPYLIKAIQELSAKVVELETKLAELESKQ